ncbi:MAG: helix-turn-helix domain-containing protein [Pontibacterium sp.]
MNDQSHILRQGTSSVASSANVLVSECSWEKLFAELQIILKQLDFIYFTYSSVPRSLGAPESQFSLSKRSYGVDTQGSMPEQVVSRYYKEIALADPLWQVLPGASQPLIVQAERNSTSPQVDQFWERYDVYSRAYVPVGGRQDKYWFNYFGLYHGLPREQFMEIYHRISGVLLPLLERCHKLLQLGGERETNPYIRHSIFSETCRQVLKMTADGMSVKMIAYHLALTEEGVTYHITRAKKIFKARNKTQLIAMLYQSGVMSNKE